MNTGTDTVNIVTRRTVRHGGKRDVKSVHITQYYLNRDVAFIDWYLQRYSTYIVVTIIARVTRCVDGEWQTINSHYFTRRTTTL